MIRGAIIGESLRPGTTLDQPVMRIVKLARCEVPGAAEYQPGVWTMVEFEAPDEVSEPLAQALAGSLLEPGWYADWKNDRQVTVVYPKRVFRYSRGDQAGRAAAQAHGRTVGVPDAQLDWQD